MTDVATFDFKDQVVLVTGAAAGIGFGIAQAFHRTGARLALGDLREPALKQAMDRLGYPRQHVIAYTMPGFATGSRTLEQARPNSS